MAKPKFNLRQRIRVHHVHAQWGTVIERTESVESETAYLVRLDPVRQAVMQPEVYGEAALVFTNATEAPRDPFATDEAAAIVASKPRRKSKR